MKPRVLVVDDDASVRFAIEEALEEKLDVVTAGNAEEAFARVHDVDAVLTDYMMPGDDGLTLAAKIRALDPELPVVLLTARGSEALAVRAMKAGVHDYLTKPFSVDELRLVLERAVEARRLRQDARAHAFERIAGRTLVGKSAAWSTLMTHVARVGARDVPVLVRGETGTGKELVAAALHAASARRDGPFVRFNCAAIPSELAEAELFGHTRGAFTGAVAERRGFFLQAHGGMLVLDEVGELPLDVQATLLRALQSGEVQRVGAARVEHADVRVIACTHRDLASDAKGGRFREDLYYRLAVVEILVPALRERRDDIPDLVRELQRRWAVKLGIEDVTLTAELVDALAQRPWPGNVRELENAVARILTLSPTGEVGMEALALIGDQRAADDTNQDAPLRARVDAFERELIERALARASGNQSEAARQLGVTRTTLLDKLKRYGLR